MHLTIEISKFESDSNPMKNKVNEIFFAILVTVQFYLILL